jgi:uncharacterized protein YjbJ (UPF0337 family)
MSEYTVVGTGRKKAGTVEFKVGEAVANDDMKADGLIDRAGGMLEHGYGTAVDLASDAIDEAPAIVERAIDRGRALGRQADATIRETFGDNGPLYVLAGVLGLVGLGIFAYSRSRSSGRRAANRSSTSRRRPTRASAKPRRKAAAAA